jgi:hypothetical protein
MPAIICPNKNDPAWKRLVAEIGENRSYIAFFRNDNAIPDVATARALLFRKSPMPLAPLTPKQTPSKSQKPKVPVPKSHN